MPFGMGAMKRVDAKDEISVPISIPRIEMPDEGSIVRHLDSPQIFNFMRANVRPSIASNPT